jgi:hypothetical protein
MQKIIFTNCNSEGLMRGHRPQTIEGAYLWINAKIAACPTAVTWEQKQLVAISYGCIYVHSMLIRSQEI